MHLAPSPRLRLLSIVAIGLIVLASVLSATAASTVTRTFSLRTGWNAVYLDVRPADPTAETVLAGLPIESVWRHQIRLTSVDFVQDPNEPVWNRDQWLVHVPTNRLESLDNNLFQIQGGFAYLLKLSAPATWRVTGEPVVRGARWKPDAFNLRGFPIDGSAAPTFRDFFKFSPAHYNPATTTLQTIYTLGTDGQWKRVDPTDLMQEGAAYWVFTSGPSEFVAPFEARTDSVDGLGFGPSLRERNLTLVNLAGSPVTITIAETDGPSTTALALGTTVPPEGLRWTPLPSLLAESLEANETKELRIAIQRQNMTGTSYESVLDVRDNLGTRFLIPVQAEKTAVAGSGDARRLASSGRRNGAGLSDDPPASPAAGLWIGTVSVTAVSEVHSGRLITNAVSSTLTDPNGSSQPLEIVREPGSPIPTRVRNEFDLRVILHVNADGEAFLLKDVIQLWRDGTYETNNAGERVVRTPGSYVLLTDSTRIREFQGAGQRDGTPVGRRISTATFDFLSAPTNNFLQLTGELGIGHSLRGDYTLFPDQPTHPFKHKFHPDHDNLDPTFKNRVEEAFEISRAFEFDFLPADPGSGLPASPEYGHSEIAGVYVETVTGLHRFPIRAEGVFRLRRVSTVASLNPPSTP
jgi:hypothetical protein